MNSKISILIEAKSLQKISKNNIFHKIIDTKYILLQQDNLQLIFNSNDIEMKYVLNNSSLYQDQIVEDEINSILQSNMPKINAKIANNFCLELEEKAILFLFKICMLSEIIIINIFNSKTTYSYRQNNTILTIESDHIFNIINYKHIVYKYEEINHIQTNLQEFKTILGAHYAIQEYKSLTGEGPEVQFLISDKIKVLSTNYIIGLIHSVQIEKSYSITKQLQTKKNLDINKVCNIFDNPEKISIVSYSVQEKDMYSRMRTNFIRFSQENNICDIRLYDSNINLFDETIIDGQIDFDNTLNMSKQDLIEIISNIKNAMDLKKVNSINLDFQKTSENQANVNIICYSSEANIKFSISLNNTIVEKFNFKIQGYTAHMINNIINKYKADCTLHINVSKTGEQGKIIMKEQISTNLIFV